MSDPNAAPSYPDFDPQLAAADDVADAVSAEAAAAQPGSVDFAAPASYDPPSYGAPAGGAPAPAAYEAPSYGSASYEPQATGAASAPAAFDPYAAPAPYGVPEPQVGSDPYAASDPSAAGPANPYAGGDPYAANPYATAGAAQQGYPPIGAYGQAMVPNAPFGIDPISGLPYSDKSKIVAGLLGIFLGTLGVGRFYMGNIGMGIAQIAVTWLTLGVGAIWPLIDGIMILAGHPKDKNGRPLRP